MAGAWRTIRVFISSTFTDMRAERRILQEKVFPDLKKYCEARGASFQAVDLRWGVNEESQREQKTMEICLTEIARCQRLSPRPNFIVLLGDRYGWQPVPNRIPTDEMEQFQAHFSDAEARLIGKWYREDTNAVPPEYVLQPRGETYRDYDQWQPVEDSLRAILRKAAAQTDFAAEQRIKYFASATHQEIINGALQTPDTGVDPADHVFSYLREMDSPPHGERAGDYLDLLPDGTVDSHPKAQMDGLKQELIDKLPQDHIYRYHGRWHDGVQFDAVVLEAFGDEVYQDLVSIIDQELQQITAVDELTREKRNQEDFARRLTRFFTGQEEPLRRISAYLKDGGDKPLAVLGPSGSGKSCLMAQAIKDAAAVSPNTIIYRFIGATAASSNPLLLLRQICAEIAEAYDTDLRSLLQEGEDDKKLGTYGGLSQIFPRCLALASEDKPLWLFLDALDQLQSHLFDFLPSNLPLHVRIVVSALPELENRLTFSEMYRLPPMPEPDGAALLDKWLATAGRTLTHEQRQEVIGKFSENGLPLYLKLAFEQVRHWYSYDMGKVLPADVDDILARYFDLLEKEHTPALVGKVAGYLLSGKYQGLTEAEILDLLVFDREYWESFVQGSHPAHREEIEELQKLPVVVWSRLFLDLEPYITELDADGVPIISFYHRKFREYAQERYLASPPGTEGAREVAFHATLARYFETGPLYLDEPDQQPNIRKVVEQPYQETLSGRWEALAETCLAHFPFLMAKARAPLVEGILEDYGLAFERMPKEWREKLKFWEAFFRERAHILRRGDNGWPAYKILLQLAVEHADDSPVMQGAESYLAAGRCTWRWLRRERRLKHAGIDPCLAVLEGHSDRVSGALVLPDGRMLSWSNDNTLRLWERNGKPLTVLEGHTRYVIGVLALPQGKILSWSLDNNLRLWDQDGKPLTVLEGHTETISEVLELPGGRILSWSSQENNLRLWDRDGKPLAVLEGHDDWVWKARAFRNGWILSWSRDETLRLWDQDGKPIRLLESSFHFSLGGALVLPDGRILSWSGYTLNIWDRDGNVLAVLKGHADWVRGALALPDGRILSWSWDNTLRLWSSKTLAIVKARTEKLYKAIPSPDGRIISWSEDGKKRLWGRCSRALAILKGHTDMVQGAIALPDGRILSWSDDRTLRLWDHKGKPLAVLKGHSEDISGVLVLINERILSLSLDKALRLWSRNGKPLAVLKGHTENIGGVLALPDGRIVSWSEDATLRIWSRAGKPLAILEGHTGAVNGVVALPERRLLSCSDDTTLRLWDAGGKPLTGLESHTKDISGVLALPEGRILSWSSDNTLRLWHAGGKPLAVLKGHYDLIRGAIELDDGKILSWSKDSTLRLWDGNGNSLAVLKRHLYSISGVLLLLDGRILSWSEDETLRIWSRAGKPLAVLKGHYDDIRGAIELDGEKILSWAEPRDKTLRIWSRVGKPLAILEGHTREVRGAIELDGGRILSWSYDKTLRIWSRAGKPLAILEGHTGAIDGVLALRDGRLLSWSWDNNLRLWNRDGDSLTVLEGHTEAVEGAIELDDGRILSWAEDRTLRLWERAGKPLAILEGHTHFIRGVLALPDGRILSWSLDKTFRLWDEDGKPLVVYGLNEGFRLDPEAKKAFYGPSRVHGDELLTDKQNTAILAGNYKSAILWHGASACTARLLQPDGRAVVTQANGQVCVLQLYHGNRPITLDELEALETVEARSHIVPELPGQRAPEPPL
jgi:WD40 repeat protein